MVTGQPLLINWEIRPCKDENLTHLFDSFHRDRPKGRRGIPSWNLSLVLHQLYKAPFEPISEVSLKHLTFKTVFLLALGSGKHRSEIHAWQNKNIRHQSDWSKVSLYPSPSFLSKNQLAKEGPDSVTPVVVPALAPTLDRSLKSDRSFVRSEPFATTWIGPQTLGRIRSWSLSPSRKVLTRTSHLPPSPHGSNRLWSYAMSSQTRKPSPYIRLKPMMLGPLRLPKPSRHASFGRVVYFLLMGLNSSLSSPTSEQVCKKGGNVGIVPGNRSLLSD